MSNPKHTPQDHVIEAESNRRSALKYLEQLNATKLTKAQIKILGSVQIMLIGQGVQIKLATEKLGGSK